MKNYYLTSAVIYGITISQAVLVETDGTLRFIPNDLDNTDYQQYLAWVEEGNTPQEWNPAEAN